jgi:hypothetical protein
MLENLKLKVDEAGAKVESRAILIAEEKCIISKTSPRFFFLDSTFWVVMQ